MLFYKGGAAFAANSVLIQGQEILRQFDVNVFGVGRMCRAVLPLMRAQRSGVIVNISSICRVGNVGQCNYSATKSAIDAMTVTWSKELSRYGIRVGAIAPGYINTEMVANIREDMLEKLVQKIPLGRLGEMNEISRTVQFIIENDFFTGRVIEVDGGMRI